MTIQTRKDSDASLAQRLNAYGPAALSDAELLSLFISGGSSTARIDKARDALVLSGGIVPLTTGEWMGTYNASPLTARTSRLLQAAHEVSRRCLLAPLLESDVLTTPEAVRRYFAKSLNGLQAEVFAALLLDNRHRVIEYREFFTGTISSAAVYPREIVKHCLSRNAASIVFAHQHPSGIAEPSDLDVRLTRRLVDALALVDIRVLDHLVIGQGQHTSLAERGLM